MTGFLGEVLATLNSRRLTHVLLALWVLSSIGSIFYLAPSVDDNIYGEQCQVFAATGQIANAYMGELQLNAYGFPGYTAISGSLCWVFSHAGVPLNVYTFKFFHVVYLVLLFPALVLAVRVCAPADRWTDARVNAVLTLLGVTSFAINVLYPRPEALAMLMIALALYLEAQAWRQSPPRLGPLFLAGLCIGIAATTHPGLLITVAVAASAMAARMAWRRQWAPLAVSAAGTILPVAAMLGWFWSLRPLSFDLLFAHAEHRSPRLTVGFESLFAEASRLVDPAAMGDLYWGLAFSMLIVVLVFAIVVAIWRLSVREYREPGPLTISCLMLGALVYWLQTGNGRIQVFTVLAFAAVLQAAMLPSSLRRPRSS